MKTTVNLHGQPTEIELKMWSKRDRDMLERKYKLGSSTYIMSIASALLQGGAKGPGVVVAKDLIKEEAARQNEDNIHYDAERVSMIVRKHDGSAFSLDVIEDLPDDEYAALCVLVTDFVASMPEKSAQLKIGLARLLRDSPMCGPALELVDNVMSGRISEKN